MARPMRCMIDACLHVRRRGKSCSCACIRMPSPSGCIAVRRRHMLVRVAAAAWCVWYSWLPSWWCVRGTCITRLHGREDKGRGLASLGHLEGPALGGEQALPGGGWVARRTGSCEHHRAAPDEAPTGHQLGRCARGGGGPGWGALGGGIVGSDAGFVAGTRTGIKSGRNTDSIIGIAVATIIVIAACPSM